MIDSHAATPSSPVRRLSLPAVRRALFLGALTACCAGAVAAPTRWLSVALAIAALMGTTFLLVEYVGVRLAQRAQARARAQRRSGGGGSGMSVPNEHIRDEDVKRLFAHTGMGAKTAGGRWQGAGNLRQVLYWQHAPATSCHQEIMEQDEVYVELREATKRVLSRPLDDVRQIVRREAAEAIAHERQHGRKWAVLHLRDMVAPLITGVCHELLFGARAAAPARAMLSACAANLISATAGVAQRDLPLREKALEYLRNMLALDGGRPEIFGGDCTLSIDQRAKYLLGVWMHTAVAQSLRLSTSALCHAAKRHGIIEALRREDGHPGPYAEAVILETLRLTPGTAMTNRVATRDIELAPGTIVRNGTDVLFDIARFHRTGFRDAGEFEPQRWFRTSKKDANFMPFGVGKRGCPAEKLVMAIATEVLHALTVAFEIRAPADRRYLLVREPQYRVSDICCLAARTSLPLPQRLAIDIWLAMLVRAEAVRRGLLQRRLLPEAFRQAFASHQRAIT